MESFLVFNITAVMRQQSKAGTSSSNTSALSTPLSSRGGGELRGGTRRRYTGKLGGSDTRKHFPNTH